jgi:predicted enzyme related to lactoylglutathione lyase
MGGRIEPPRGEQYAMTETQTMPRTNLTSADRTNGDIWWIDLSTPDLAKAKEFYTGLVGWTFEDQGEEFGHYNQVRKDGKVVAGAMAQDDEMRKMGAPPAWTPYISVADAKATVAKAKDLGAKVLVEPMPVGELGWMAVLADPTGAVFGLWQGEQFTGADLINSTGALCWTEVRTPDADAAAKFYEALLGWKAVTAAMGPVQYTTLELDGHPAAGLWKLEGDMADVPPHWGVTIGVDSIDEALAYTRANGGKVIVEPATIPFGTFAGIIDPTGAAITLIQLAPMNRG